MTRKAAIDMCWKRIGVWSKQVASCPELAKVVHCRNCKTYVKAGREYMRDNSVIDANEMFRRGKHYATPIAERKINNEKVTVFRIGKEWLALDTSFIDSVIDIKASRWIPHRSGELIKGVANIDGEAVVVVSVRSLLGVEKAVDYEINDDRRIYPRMIVLGNGVDRVMFSVAEVCGRYRYAEGVLRPTPETVNKAMMTYTQGLLDIDGRQVGVLDGALVIYSIKQALKS